MAAYGAYMAMREAAVKGTVSCDFVISPTSPILPYEAELPAPGNDPHNAFPHICFTVAYNMSEQPAASLNWTFSTGGLPIGVQVIGRRFDDLGVLGMSAWLERARPTQRDWPQP
jgi:aspartyl-tRNA(Asn)/glutamyl-tRNA(Gln) amidotransferase subunit A